MNTLIIVSGEPSELLNTVCERLVSKGETLIFIQRNEEDKEQHIKLGEVFVLPWNANAENYNYWVNLICKADRIISWR